MKKVYFFSVYWWILYLGISIVVSFLILLIVLFPLGISVASDAVFGVLALLSFICSDLIFKKVFNIEMLISKKIPYSILYTVIPLSFFVIFFGLT